MTQSNLFKGNIHVNRAAEARWFEFLTGNKSQIINFSVDPTVVSQEAPKGSIGMREDVSAVYIKLDDGDSTNWRRLSDLVTFSTVAEAKAASGSDNLLGFVVESGTFYRYESDGASYTANDEQYLITGDGGDTRWLAVAGFKAIEERFQQYAQTIKSVGFPKSGSDNESTLSFDEGTRTLTLTPTVSETIWRQEERFAIDSAINAVIDNTEGRWFVYYGKDAADSGSVQLRATQSFSDDMRKRDALVASIYWDATNGKAIVRDERHSAGVPSETRFSDHATKGTLVAAGGGAVSCTIGDGSLSVHAQISVADHVVIDEDIRRSIAGFSSVPAQIPMVYFDGTNVRWDAATNVPAKISTGQAQYNSVSGGSGSQVAIPDGEFVCTHLISVGDDSKKIVGIQGRAAYPSANDAYSAAGDELRDIMVDMESFLEDAVVIATVVFEADQSFAEDVRLEQNWLGETSIDWTANSINVINKGVGEVLAGTYPATSTSSKRSRRSTSSNTTMSFVSDDVLWADSSSGNLTITLPTPAAENDGQTFTIKKTSASNQISVVGQASETIDGEASYELLSGKPSVTVQTDGAEWMVI